MGRLKAGTKWCIAVGPSTKVLSKIEATVRRRRWPLKVFYPMVTTPACTTREFVVKAVPAFPGYYFLAFHPDDLSMSQLLDSLPFWGYLDTRGRVTKREEIYWLTRADILRIKQDLAERTLEARQKTERTRLIGQTVQIEGTAFSGFTGRCVELRGEYAIIETPLFNAGTVLATVPIAAIQSYAK